MHDVHAATLTILRESFAALRDTLDGLPPAALDWKPYPDGNTLAVLTMHSIAATRFWIAAGCGQPRSLAEYRSGERQASFEVKGRVAPDLQASIDGAVEQMAGLLGQGTAEQLERKLEWPEDPSVKRTGAESLIHAIAHLREHVGQAWMTRDLWERRGTELPG